ncbi:pentatricopeptide repeat-containing protein At1g03540 [Magnolia sinica]|uniref:pentatricopeptide repeat-containing protein At1g03540 n=1 Tax=Magnolia sinica TaxID=86752 RepID=UPI00265A34AA|nr:pentatricopeptide repeat-containing protein At1g03540 [Magnolia sinica]
MYTKLLSKRHFTSILHPNLKESENPSSQSIIIHLCKSNSLSQAIRLLNSTDPIQISAKPIIYASLLQTSTKSLSFISGLQIHSCVIKSGLDSDRFVGNSLLSLYFKLSSDFSDTRRVFDGLLIKDVVTWTSMVSGYVRSGEPEKSLKLFCEMSDFGVEPNAFTLSASIKACSEVRDVRLGMGFHGKVLGRGFDSNCVIASSLIDMYGRNLCLEDARRVFDEMVELDAISWTSLISVFTRNDRFEEALGLFYLMQRNYGLVSDGFTFGTILTACGNLGRLKQGKEVHAKVVTAGICSNVVVESSLVDMYGKCKSVEDSRQVFDRMTMKNSVSWCALLGGYCQNGNYESVLGLFREMKKEGDHYSFGTVLRACAGLAAMRLGKEVHCHYLRTGGWRDVIVESALIDLYAKSGYIDHAYRVFTKIPVRNLITWNSMICGFAQNGRGEEALRMFDGMIKEGIRPDYISFIGVLFACSHSGFVDRGRGYFISMKEDYSIKAGIEHYNCMVDLLGRAGLLEEAEDLIGKAEDFGDDSSLWAALLGACTAHSNMGVAERVAKKMMELEPDYHLSYVLLGNVYKAAGQWGDALKIRKLMENRGIKKTPGKSWIEVKSNVGSFLHPTNLVPLKEESPLDIKGLNSRVRRDGCGPDVVHETDKRAIGD